MLDPVDFLALQSIRKALEDAPGSHFFSSWDFTGDPCAFSGVFCAGDRVVALSLGDPRAGSPGLLGRLDPAVGRLSVLAELSLVPQGRRAGALRHRPAGQPPSARWISASTSSPAPSRRASGPSPRCPTWCSATNRLSGTVPSFYSPSLVRLDLKHNNLSGEVTVLPDSLQYLSLSWNRLEGPVGGVVARLVQLNYLDLGVNRFTGAIPSSVFSFPLTSLQLQRNRFTGSVLPPEEVAIPTVDLSYNRLSGPISPTFAAVRSLYLNNNQFTGEVPASFVARLLDSGIQILYLQHNYLTGIQMNPTAEIPMSSSLCLQYNCMVPPVAAPCPVKAGRVKTRPTAQCVEWRG
ncbi:unnamed protein product [Spirodela intermedia]|uniref:Leucine-rich repeat-containing N-terminal plant-type domain-containing protein n=1 Tax=Spirodela intermedia TaxID=51605 RepID=A0A7I8J2E6_SPIIN|nr:unnamed protein product [Spirodela intermedia]CAA6663490.1 unnamed protein product [Spirodela intermedia]